MSPEQSESPDTPATQAGPTDGGTATVLSDKPVDVSVVLPCLNEEQTVASCVSKARSWFESARLRGEVIVVDNGSTDRSREEALAAGARVVDESQRGYGAAHRRGFAEARGDIIIMADADDTYDLSDLGPLVEPLSQGYDMVVGNRLKTLSPGAMTWSHRFIGTPALTTLLGLFSGSRLGDSQCGLRAFTREAYERMALKSTGMELASEMILKSARRGLKMAEVPIPYHPRVAESKLNTFRDGWRHLRFLILASPSYLYTVPGVFLILVGILTLGLALPSSHGIDIGPLRWQPIFGGTIFLVVGMNAVLLGLASRIYTTARGDTKEDWLLRLYRRYLGLEGLFLFGLFLMVCGFGVDLFLMISSSAGSDPSNWVDIAAVAQSLIVIGANLLLVGVLAGVLEAE
ncbi:MAG TPA: glycosyltransferase family 2 protein [Dehalococcoidia bacterium]|nr:glycosyltransferase family 2 protein [Dehalococcoidia bacterium]